MRYCDGGLIFGLGGVTAFSHFPLLEQFEEGLVFAQVTFVAQVAIEAGAFIAIFVNANGVLFLEGFVAFCRTEDIAFLSGAKSRIDNDIIITIICEGFFAPAAYSRFLFCAGFAFAPNFFVGPGKFDVFDIFLGHFGANHTTCDAEYKVAFGVECGAAFNGAPTLQVDVRFAFFGRDK